MSTKPRITLLVVDLDNTLWDWFDIWYRAFAPFLEELSRLTGIPTAILKPQIKQIHQKHGTAEYSFLLEELPCLKELYGDFNAFDKFPALIRLYQQERDKATALYPDVLPTLRRIRAAGCRLVAYTESLAFYTNQRIRKMGLDGILDYVYSPADHDIPAHLSLEQIRQYSPDKYALAFTKHRATPPGILKPNTRVLATILRDFSVPLGQAAYIGDNISKDVLMARQLAVTSVHAKYGETHGDPRYSLLVDVTHWTNAMVAAQATTTRQDVTPDITLDHSFRQVLDYFDFDSPHASDTVTAAQAVEAWKQTVNTQQHFNDLQLRLRSFMITLLVAVLGASAFAFKEHNAIHVYGMDVSTAVLVCLAGLIGVLAFFYMDYGYHHLLLGAVGHGMAIERDLQGVLPAVRLAHAIKDSSPTPPLHLLVLPRSWYDRLEQWAIKRRLPLRDLLILRRGSTRRLKHFYGGIGLLMILVMLFAQFTGVLPRAAMPPTTTQDTAIQHSQDCGTAALRKYFASGAYETAIQQVLANGYALIQQTTNSPPPQGRLAAVFDVDETALSTWTILDQGAFCWDKARYEAHVLTGTLPAIRPVHDFYQFLRSRGITCFFVTSRRERMRVATEANLQLTDYVSYEALFMMPDADQRTATAFKTDCRAQIESRGYTILINAGDQQADLAGGHAQQSLLLPNPFYGSP